MQTNLRQRVLLSCGMAAAVLYVAMTLCVGRLWPSYSVTSQTISELSAIGAPTRPLWLWLAAVYALLFIAFAWIVWASAPPNTALRVAGALLLIQGVFGLFWPPMHQRVALAAGGATLTDSLHILWTIVTSVLFMGAMGFGAAAFGTRFRVYSIVTTAIVFASGAWTGTYAARLQADLPTPGAGVWERVNTTAFMVWIAVLATTLLRRTSTARMTSRSSAFKNSAGKVAFLTTYDAALKRWPVPYEEIDVPTRFGTTHVVASGPADAPPMVLLHGHMATSVMWAPNIADFARGHRVYAIDVMGQPSKSIPDEPVCSAADFVAWLTMTLDALHLERIALVGMSFGGWIALRYAAAAPNRVQHLVLLSPGGLLPLRNEFHVRGMLMVFVPTQFTVRSLMRWVGLVDRPGETQVEPVLRLIYLGLKYFRMPPETSRIMPTPLSDDALASLPMPVLLLIGEDEVLYDASAALARARRLIPSVDGALVPGCRHDMVFRRADIVDARVVEFLEQTRPGDQARAQYSAA